MMVQQVMHLDEAYAGDLGSYSEVELFDLLRGLEEKVPQSVMLLHPQASGRVYHFTELYGAAERVVDELEERELVEVTRKPRPGPYGSRMDALFIDAKDRDEHFVIDYFLE